MGDIIVGIDIGTTKVCTVIGRVDKAGGVEVLGKGLVPCVGVRKGVIVDIDKTASAVRESVVQAEEMADMKIGSAYINIIGMHVNVIRKRCGAAIANEDREITKKDLDRLLYTLRDIEVEEDKQVIDIIPRQYVIDGYDEIIDPVGMVGAQLEVDADIVAGKITSVQNLVKSLERAGLKIDGIIVEAFATSEMVLLPDEKEMGVILIDVGGGVTDISVFKNGRLMFYNSIPVGGEHITNDIAIGMRISNVGAEKIKREYELALTSLIKNDQETVVYDINENKRKTVMVSDIVEIIEARVHEIFSLCKSMLSNEGIDPGIAAGVVLAGGGISYVDGGKQLASEVFGLPVRVAAIKNNTGPIPEMVTAEGMIKYASGIKRGNKGSEVKSISKPQKSRNKPAFFSRIKRLLDKMF